MPAAAWPPKEISMQWTHTTSPPSLRRLTSGRAMTFIEIMIVILIFGVLAALAAPTMRNVHNRNKFAATAREITNTLRYARQQAVLRNHSTEVLFWVEKNEYKLDLQPPDTEQKKRYSSRNRPTEPMEDTRQIDPKDKRVSILQIESDDSDKKQSDSQDKDAVRTRFYRNGSATPTTIVLKYDRKSRNNDEGEPDILMTVQIAAATGAVRVYSGGPTDAKVDIPEWGTTGENQNAGGKDAGNASR